MLALTPTAALEPWQLTLALHGRPVVCIDGDTDGIVMRYANGIAIVRCHVALTIHACRDRITHIELEDD